MQPKRPLKTRSTPFPCSRFCGAPRRTPGQQGRRPRTCFLRGGAAPARKAPGVAGAVPSTSGASFRPVARRYPRSRRSRDSEGLRSNGVRRRDGDPWRGLRSLPGELCDRLPRSRPSPRGLRLASPGPVFSPRLASGSSPCQRPSRPGKHAGTGPRRAREDGAAGRGKCPGRHPRHPRGFPSPGAPSPTRADDRTGRPARAAAGWGALGTEGRYHRDASWLCWRKRLHPIRVHEGRKAVRKKPSVDGSTSGVRMYLRGSGPSTLCSAWPLPQ